MGAHDYSPAPQHWLKRGQTNMVWPRGSLTSQVTSQHWEVDMISFARLVQRQNQASWVLAAMAGAIGLVLLDETVAAVALPTISDDLNVSLLDAQWDHEDPPSDVGGCTAPVKLGDTVLSGEEVRWVESVIRMRKR